MLFGRLVLAVHRCREDGAGLGLHAAAGAGGADAQARMHLVGKVPDVEDSHGDNVGNEDNAVNSRPANRGIPPCTLSHGGY